MYNSPHESSAVIDRLVAERDEARRKRDWPLADALKAQIEMFGDAQWQVKLTDTPDGTRWHWSIRT